MRYPHPCLRPCFYLWSFASCLLLAAAPATQPAGQIRTWFDQLADPSADVRRAALHELLGLTPADLPTLQRVVAASRPIRPSQRGAINDIVYHVYISGLTYEPSASRDGFLGVAFDFLFFDLDENQRRGVIITECEQGFPAYRVLRPGDIIKGIEQIQGLTFENTEQFSAAIRSFKAGETIVLQIEREGRPQRVPVMLGVRPATIDFEPVSAWRADLRARADQYWNEHFAKLLDDGPA